MRQSMDVDDDSLDPLVTECPNCGTRFRVSESQLQIANGRVRCGACLTVFQGTDHLLLNGERVGAPSQDGDLDAMLDELDAPADSQAADPVSQPPADPNAQPPPQQSTQADKTAPVEADEGLDEEVADELAQLEAQLLDELKRDAGDTVSEPADADDEQRPAPAPAAPPALSDATPTLPQTDAEPAQLDAPAPRNGDDPDWLDEVADDVWQAEATPSDAVVQPEPSLPPADASEQSELAAEAAQTANAGEQPDNDVAVAFDYDELDLEEETSGRSWLTWMMIGLALVALPVQVLWFQYQDWSVDPRFRPLYQRICTVIGCELQQMVDLSRISSKNTAVRTHPQRSDALVVDALILNEAEFAQPYPVIELVFTSLQGELVAGRRFQPQEYLAGGVGAAQMLAPNTPTHISIEIKDPGPDAKGYNLRFR